MNFLRLSRRFSFGFIFLFALTFCVERSFAAQTLLGGKTNKVDADPKKDYILKESDGNWFAMAKKFSGDKAALQAKRLAYELRASYQMKAFVFKFDPDQVDMDALSIQMGKNKKFHYQTARSIEYAVLVGGFPTGEDLELQKTLARLRKLQPKSLADKSQNEPQQGSQTTPLSNATPVPNPLLPPEYFNHKGIVDPFVAKLNSDSKYSLLNNPKTYTVRIATFSGDSSMKKSSESFDNLETRLQYAGLRAAALCEALRNQGVEAWEFHDRDCSFVTIGSFDKYGTLQKDGHTELNPKVAEIMKKYGGSLVDGEDGHSKYQAYTIVVEIPDPASSSFAPKKKKLQLACDLRPVIIVVPQRSGEESVKKIALATQEMDRAKQQIVENVVERSLEAAENDLESAKQFANMNGEALTEEEYFAWTKQNTAKKAPSAPTAQVASTNVPYAAKATTSTTPKQGNVVASEKYQARMAQPQASKAPQQTTASTASRPNAAQTVASTSRTSSKANASATRPYNGATKKTTKTAQRNAAPTY